MKQNPITFAFIAPNAHTVNIAGSFNDWNITSDPLRQSKDGATATSTWRKTMYLEPGIYEYRFVVDGAWQNDPTAEDLWKNDFGSFNCVVWV